MKLNEIKRQALNERPTDSELYAKEISSMIGVGAKAVEKWMKDNNVDELALTMAVGQNKSNMRKDLQTAILGTPNNMYAKKILKMYTK